MKLLENLENPYLDNIDQIIKRREEPKPVFNIDEERLKLFGEHFVQMNKINCKLLIEGNEMDLCEYYTTNSKEKTFQIKLIVKETIKDFVGMFKDCRNLYACPDLDTLDTSKATSFKGFFENGLKIYQNFFRHFAFKKSFPLGIIFERIRAELLFRTGDAHQFSVNCRHFLTCRSVIKYSILLKTEQGKNIHFTLHIMRIIRFWEDSSGNEQPCFSVQR